MSNESPRIADSMNILFSKILQVVTELQTWISSKTDQNDGREKIKAFVKKINLLGITKNHNKNQ